MDTDGDPRAPWERNFRQEMKRRRELRGLSQTDLARQVKERNLPFHQQTIQRIEKGERPVRLDEAFVIAEVLDAELGDLVRSDPEAAAFERMRVELLKVIDIHAELTDWIERFRAAQAVLKETLEEDRQLLESGVSRAPSDKVRGVRESALAVCEWLVSATLEEALKLQSDALDDPEYQRESEQHWEAYQEYVTMKRARDDGVDSEA